MGHLPVGGVGDHVRVRFIQADPEEAIVVGRLLFRGDSQPFSIRIEVRHLNFFVSEAANYSGTGLEARR
jgi:hypothetical protein